MKYQVMVYLIETTEKIVDGEGLDCNEDHKAIRKIARDYVKGKADPFGTIAEYKKRAKENNAIEVWVAALDDNYNLKDYEYIDTIS